MRDLRWGFFYYRRGRKRSFGRLGVPPRGWRASPPKRAAGEFWFGEIGMVSPDFAWILRGLTRHTDGGQALSF